MKNLQINKENIKKLTAGVVAGFMLMTGNVNASAASKDVTAQDVVNAMINESKLEAEITQEQAEELMSEAEKAIEKAGASLLPEAIEERYNDLKNQKGKQKTETEAVIAGLCDTMLLDGTAANMSYAEAIQFDNVCETVCESLINKGYTAIYSEYKSNMFGERNNVELEEIAKLADQNRRFKKTSYITALGTDLGFYDHCFGYDENPQTGVENNIQPMLYIMAASALTAAATKKKSKEKVYKR